MSQERGWSSLEPKGGIGWSNYWRSGHFVQPRAPSVAMMAVKTLSHYLSVYDQINSMYYMNYSPDTAHQVAMCSTLGLVIFTSPIKITEA